MAKEDRFYKSESYVICLDSAQSNLYYVYSASPIRTENRLACTHQDADVPSVVYYADNLPATGLEGNRTYLKCTQKTGKTGFIKDYVTYTKF